MLRVVLQHPTPTAENRTRLVTVYCIGVDARPRVWSPPLLYIYEHHKNTTSQILTTFRVALAIRIRGGLIYISYCCLKRVLDK